MLKSMLLDCTDVETPFTHKAQLKIELGRALTWGSLSRVWLPAPAQTNVGMQIPAVETLREPCAKSLCFRAGAGSTALAPGGFLSHRQRARPGPCSPSCTRNHPGLPQCPACPFLHPCVPPTPGITLSSLSVLSLPSPAWNSLRQAVHLLPGTEGIAGQGQGLHWGSLWVPSSSAPSVK